MGSVARPLAVGLILLALTLVDGLPLVAQAPGTHPVTGRRIAPTMSHLGAEWLDRPEREQEENPRRAIRALKIRPGEVVADVGAGSGYYTSLLARAVAPGGKVYATDIQPEMLQILRGRLARERLTSVELVLGGEDDPHLPARCCDRILMVDVYHELSRPQVMMRRLREALRPGGQLVLLEFRKESPWVPIREEHKMSVADARAELAADGFRLDEVLDVLPWQHILVFRPASDPAP